MGSFGKERNRVREVTADALDHRKAGENQQGKEKPTLTGIVPVAMRGMPMTMPMPMPMLVVVLTPVRMCRRCAVARVMVIAVMVVRVRHGLRNR